MGAKLNNYRCLPKICKGVFWVNIVVVYGKKTAVCIPGIVLLWETSALYIRV